MLHLHWSACVICLDTAAFVCSPIHSEYPLSQLVNFHLAQYYHGLPLQQTSALVDWRAPDHLYYWESTGFAVGCYSHPRPAGRWTVYCPI